MPLLEVSEVDVRFGGIVALDGATFHVDEGQICGLIGPNGAGKTTLFNCVSRIYTPNAGRILFDGKNLLEVAPHEITGIGIARTFQNLGLFPTQTVLENVMVGAHHRTQANFLTTAFRTPKVRREERELRDECLDILYDLELGQYAQYPATGLPYGTLKRIELARALASRSRLVMMDEPASGLTHSEVDELGGVIKHVRDRFALTVLVVEHHMSLVMGISDKVVALDFGRVIAQGRPEEVARDPQVVEAYLGASS